MPDLRSLVHILIGLYFNLGNPTRLHQPDSPWVLSPFYINDLYGNTMSIWNIGTAV